MSNASLNDLDYESALTRGNLVAAAAIAQFYNFASRCLDWAKTTRSLKERAVYVQMGLQWLAAGARLHTFLQIDGSQDVALKAGTQRCTSKTTAPEIERAAAERQIDTDPSLGR
jgi:hypothetical protein